MQFFGQLQQPCPAVSPLERLAVGRSKVVGLGLQVRGGEVFAQHTADLAALGQIGKLAQQPHEHPMAVDR